MTPEEQSDLAAVATNWNLVDPTKSIDAKTFLAALADKVAELLAQDRRKFMNDLYRLDVSEEGVQRVLRSAPPQDQPLLLAKLILDRELKKAATRRAAAALKS